MTQEEKSKAYDKVREKIKVRFGTNVAEEIFSEFEETEDERIRKEIIKFLELPHPQFVGKRHQEDWLAWLEKQGEQKSAWSVEDKAKIQRICKYLDEAKKYYADITEVRECINWLKSLKQRYTWKPSDEQIQAVRLVRVFVTDDFGENPTLSDILLELEEQLKKVKGE